MGELAEDLRRIPVFARLPLTFDPTTAPARPQDLFADWLRAAIADGAPEPHAMVLSTSDASGHPDARALILKDVDERGWWFAGSSASPKGTQLAEVPAAALTFYWPTLGRQIRVRGSVEAAGPAESARDFLARAPGGRAEALVGRQSEPLADPADLRAAFEAAKARVDAEPESVAPGWTRYVVVPSEVQFFQGDRQRRHVRLRYQRTGDGWTHTLLWP
ncbi:MAG TPA: pyridoxal 5'-phosphate synthase [Pseudonocardiaceae bacterium]|jgi:pyridoxamine 5'-phosphate oxidase|nr:pyridoxal 5'-phosphate synthase [Pseudonocardiaceae bacterium]